MTPDAAAQLRAQYLAVVLEALSMDPLPPLEELACTAGALLCCEVPLGHKELLDAVVKTCIRSPDFLRTLMGGSFRSFGSSSDAYNVLNGVVTDLVPTQQRTCLRRMDAIATCAAAPTPFLEPQFPAGENCLVEEPSLIVDDAFSSIVMGQMGDHFDHFAKTGGLCHENNTKTNTTRLNSMGK
eukprot:jgi/Chrzof1/10450/UNPLg00377.t1